MQFSEAVVKLLCFGGVDEQVTCLMCPDRGTVRCPRVKGVKS